MALALGLLAIGVAAVALIGNLTGRPILATWYAGGPNMKDAAAIAIITCSASMIVGTLNSVRLRWLRDPALVLALLAGILGGSTLLLYLAATVAAEELGPFDVLDRNMPSLATVGLILAFSRGMGHRLIAGMVRGSCRQSRLVGSVIVGFSLCAILGHALGVPALFFYAPRLSAGMALPTAVVFLALGSGLLALPSTRLAP